MQNLPKSPCACTTDLCVWGAVCAGAKDDGSMSGICTPVVKGTDTSSTGELTYDSVL